MKDYEIISKIIDSLNNVNFSIRTLEKEYNRSLHMIEQKLDKKKKVTQKKLDI